MPDETDARPPPPAPADGPWRIAPTADGSATLAHAEAGETYHSHHGARTEARHVFLELSGIRDRIEAGASVAVLEIGFGTGLNFLVTADAVRAARTRNSIEGGDDGPRLVYRAVDRRLPPAPLLERLDYAGHLAAPELAHGLVAARAALPPEADALGFAADGVDLDVALGDAVHWDPGIAGVDAVYLDAFSPDTQPELWTAEVLRRWTAALRPGGRLCTYSVKGAVRRRLAALGLDVQKRPGPPGGKREALVATAPDGWDGPRP